MHQQVLKNNSKSQDAINNIQIYFDHKNYGFLEDEQIKMMEYPSQASVQN